MKKKFLPAAVTVLFALALVFILLWVFVFNGMFLKHRLPKKYEEFVSAAAEKNGLDEYLVYAIISTESGFRPAVVSRAGAVGLMQLMPETAEWLGGRYGLPCEDLTDPETNINLGCAYLAFLTERFPLLENAVAAYNAGHGNVTEWLENPKYSSDGEHLSSIPYKETARYVSRVLSRYEIYQKLYG